MGDYTNMSAYYDVIMTSGYYNYPKIVDALLHHGSINSVLEIGCGTGLILEEFASRQPQATMTGIDLTASMLKIAEDRLKHFPNIFLSQQNIIQLQLTQKYELAYSYGGVWYFVIDGDNEPFMVSHLAKDADNHNGLQQLTEHIESNGQLLLGVQGPHFDYEKVITNGMTYSQKILPCDDGFIKSYYLSDASTVVMSQTIHYRTYSFPEALKLLAQYGFHYQHSAIKQPQFLEFRKQ